MQFGQVENPAEIDFSLPADALETKEILNKHQSKNGFKAYVGCAKWNRTDLKGFYPRGTKDELTYYATQFNSVELNATFYKSPDREQVIQWKEKVSEDFKFFPKIPQSISHYGALNNFQERLTQFCDAVSNFEDHLGMVFLQMRESFKPKDLEKVKAFVSAFPKAIPLAVELRNEEWFTDKKIADEVFQLFAKNKVANIIVDTAGRRDMLHMKLSTPQAFIRYVGANHESDYTRLDEWVERIVKWKKEGLQELYFFVHQNEERASPLLSAHFIKNLNKALDLELTVPKIDSNNPPLF